MFDALLDALEEELQAALGTAVKGLVATARTQLGWAVAEVAEERAKALAEVAEERAKSLAEVEARKEEVGREITAMQKHKEAQEGRVELNIGGYRFETSVQTLRRIPQTFFDAYFSGRYAQDVCNDGSIFVDRDGEHFGHVLEYMRDGVVTMMEPGAIPSVPLLRALKREFGYYCIELQIGTVFAVGGFGNPTVKLASMERYNTVSNAWHALAPMATARHSFGLSSCAGDLYVTGGNDGGLLASVERYSPNLDTWSTAPAMLRPRQMHCACSVGEIIYVIGGTEDLAEDTLATRSMLKFDHRTQSWNEAAPMPAGRQEAAACVLGSDIYVFGGQEEEEGEEISSTFRFNTETNEWTTLAPMPEAKHGHGVCTVDGLIYVVGGRFSSSVFCFDPAAASWRSLAPILAIRHGASVFALGGIIYVAGGYHYQIEHSSVERYCVASDTWTLVKSMEMEAARSHFGTIVLEGGDEMDFFDHLIAEASRASV
jgi:hypothetical protein